MDDMTFRPSLLWNMDPKQVILALQHTCDSKRIQKLEHRLQAYRLNLQKAQDKIQRLTALLSEMLQEVLNLNSSQSLSDRIYYDFVKNHGRHPNRCRYSLETLIWTQEIHPIFPAALDLIRRALPLPGEPLFQFSLCPGPSNYFHRSSGPG
jgi:hypothetical protein